MLSLKVMSPMASLAPSAGVAEGKRFKDELGCLSADQKRTYIEKTGGKELLREDRETVSDQATNSEEWSGVPEI